jgi:uncharacterized DUF497 family protein
VESAFEWDEEKEAANRAKHGVSFKEACEVFFDPFNLTIPDPDHSVEEERLILLGFGAGNLLVVNFTERGDAIRIISSRKANTKERRVYEQKSRR